MESRRDLSTTTGVSKSKISAQLDILKIERPKLPPGSWLDVIDVDGDGFVSEQDFTSCLWMTGNELDLKEFTEYYSMIREASLVIVDDKADWEVVHLLSGKLDTLFGVRNLVASAIEGFEERVLSQGKYTFRELFIRRFFAYLFCVGGILWIPALQNKNHSVRPDLKGVAHMQKQAGWVIGILLLSSYCTLAWYFFHRSPELESDICDISISNVTSNETLTTAVGKVEMLAPFLVCAVTALIVCPIREARAFSKEQILRDERFQRENYFRSRYIPLSMIDGSHVSLASFHQAFLVGNASWNGRWSLRPPRFRKYSLRQSNNRSQRAFRSAGLSGLFAERGSVVKEKMRAATTELQYGGFTAKSFFSGIDTIFLCALLAVSPSLVRLHNCGTLLPTYDPGLAVLSMIQTFVILSLATQFVIRKATLLDSKGYLNQWLRALKLAGFSKTVANSRYRSKHIFDPFISIENIEAFDRIRTISIEESNFYSRKWLNVTHFAVLAASIVTATSFALFALFSENAALISVYNAYVLLWNVMTMKMVFQTLLHKAEHNKQAFDKYMSFLAEKVLQMNSQLHSLQILERKQSVDEAILSMERRIRTLKDVINVAKYSHQAEAKMLGMPAKYTRIAQAAVYLTGALLSGLFRMVLSE